MKERHPLSYIYNSKDEALGIFNLEYLADPNSVHIKLYGKEICFSSTNELGHPILSVAQTEELSSSDEELTFEIIYDKIEFNVKPESFDSAKGIMLSLESESTFFEMLKNRARYLFVTNYRKPLNHFAIKGNLYLDKFGNLELLSAVTENNTPCTEEDLHLFKVESFDYFLKRCKYAKIEHFILALGEITEKVVCPYCKENISLTDILNGNLFTTEDGECHLSCCMKKN